MSSVLPTGHRRRGSGFSTDVITDLERAIILARHKGRTVYVDSAAAAGGNGDSWGGAYTTLAAAAAAGLADDTVLIAPGHTENIVAAAGIAITKAGTTIIGLGNGKRRPTFTWATLTTATWTITGANVSIVNIICTSTIVALAKLFSVTAAGATFDTVDYYEDGTTDALQFILTTAAAVDLTVANCHWYRGTTAASALSQWIVLTGADRAKIQNNFGILKGFTTGNPINSWIAVVTTFCVGVQITDNEFYDSNSTGNVPILTIASTTGVVARNWMGTSATVTTIGYSSCFAHQNFISNEVAKSGAVAPAIDTLS